MSVDDFLYLLKFKHKNSKSMDPYGTKGISFEYELKWKESKLTNVILNYKNSILIDLKAKSDVIINYGIEDNLIEEITFTYLDLPKKYIERLFDQRYMDRKIYGFYFSEDYKFFRVVFESNDGYGAITLSKAEWPYLGRYMLDDIRKLQEKYKKGHQEE